MAVEAARKGAATEPITLEKVVPELEKKEGFLLKIRNPQWSKNTAICVNGQKAVATPGYIILDRFWKTGDVVELELDMRVFVHRPIAYGSQILMNQYIPGKNYIVPTFDREDPLAKHHIALQRGPLMLAQENRLGYSVDDPIDVAINKDETVSATVSAVGKAPYPALLEMQIPLTDGREMTVTDYGSAGKLWNESSKMAVWMLTV